MTTGKDDLNKATQLGTRYNLGGNWTGRYHQAEMGFSDGLRSEGKGDVVDQKTPHEAYGYWLNQQRVQLKNGTTTISGWDAHYTCMKHFEKCTDDMYPQFLYEDNFVGNNALKHTYAANQRDAVVFVGIFSRPPPSIPCNIKNGVSCSE